MFTNTWHMHRLGLIDFWYYVNEEFYFNEGHMLLRGSNGSGKSVTMQSFIPLLLDGNKSSERLDPFGTRSRKLENYLIEDDSPRDDRIGYLYLEFKREGVEVYKTIGLGLHARKNKPLDTWYFVIEDNRRINYEIQLMENHLAITKNVCKSLLQNQFIETQKEYMDRVNQALFGFPTRDDYKETIDLLLQVRSPKLSNSLKPTMLNETLSHSLQPLSDEDLRPMSEAIQSMDEIRDQVQTLKESCDSSIAIARIFEQYNYAVMKKKATSYAFENQKYQQLIKEQENNQKEIFQLQENLKENEEKQKQIDEEKKLLQEQKNSLSNQDLLVIAEEIERLQQEKKEAQITLTRKQEKSDSKHNDVQDAKNNYDKNVRESEKNEILLQEIFQELDSIHEEIQWHEHSFIRDEVMSQLDQPYDYSYSLDSIQNEIQDLAYGKEQYQYLNQVKQNQNHWINEKEKEMTKKENKEKELELTEQLYDETLDEIVQNFYSWNKNNQHLICSDQIMLQIVDHLQKYMHEDDYDRVEDIIHRIYFNQQHDLLEQKLKYEHEKQQLEHSYYELEQCYQEWMNQVDPTPVLDEYGYQNRNDLRQQQIDFIPFYSLLEFDAQISNDEKNRIEEMLQRMGLLNALVINEKDKENVLKHREGCADAYLFTPLPLAQCTSYWIKDFDLPAILATFKIDTEYLSLQQDYYENGYLFGTISGKEEAKFIGKESRKLYREQKLAAYQKQMDEHQQLIQKHESLLAQLQLNEIQLKQEFDAYPKKDDLELAKKSVLKLETELHEMNERITAFQKEISHIETQINSIQKVISELAEKCGISSTQSQFETQYEGMQKYSTQFHHFIDVQRRYVNQCELMNTLHSRKEELEDDLNELTAEIYQWKSTILHKEKMIASKQQQLDEQGYHDLQQKIKMIHLRLEEIQKEEKEIDGQSGRIEERIVSLKQHVAMKYEEETKQKELVKESQKIYFEEFELGYVKFENIIVNQVDEMIRAIEKTMPHLKNVENLGPDLQRVFYEHRGNLQEYSLTLDQVFSDQTDALRLNISARYKGKKVSFNELVEALTNDIETQKLLLVESERELIEDILVNTISKKIRVHIQNSKHWVEQMNKYMNQMSTSSTMKLSLLWKSHKAENEDELNSEKLVELLTKDIKLLKDSDRNRLSNHFKSKIATARKLSELDEVNESFHVIMKRVMDYRTWFEFKIMIEKANEKKKELTNTIFFQLSGGEKAMSMYIPLFSAVAAKFEGARDDAPRLIALDEAFAGVDEKNIDNMFALIQKFNFDYIMNSQVLWGDYASVQALNIHELVRPENAKYVAVISYAWNGHEKVLIPS